MHKNYQCKMYFWKIDRFLLNFKVKKYPVEKAQANKNMTEKGVEK